jgi:hypothetical protein
MKKIKVTYEHQPPSPTTIQFDGKLLYKQVLTESQIKQLVAFANIIAGSEAL